MNKDKLSKDAANGQFGVHLLEEHWMEGISTSFP
jgi:hypothetical protein